MRFPKNLQNLQCKTCRTWEKKCLSWREALWKGKLIQDSNFVFWVFFSWKPGHWTERWRKESWFIFHYYFNCDSCRPVVNTRYQQGIAEACLERSRRSTMENIFAKKLHRRCWLGSKYASQSAFNDATFILELIFIGTFQSISIYFDWLLQISPKYFQVFDWTRPPFQTPSSPKLLLKLCLRKNNQNHF